MVFKVAPYFDLRNIVDFGEFFEYFLRVGTANGTRL